MTGLQATLVANVPQVYTVVEASTMYLNQRTTLKPPRQDLDPDPTVVVPSGYYGAGIWTAHPIGLFIVSGLIAIGIWGMPDSVDICCGAAIGGR